MKADTLVGRAKLALEKRMVILTKTMISVKGKEIRINAEDGARPGIASVESRRLEGIVEASVF
jgi:hypothetical protein